eukprot:TRINITY_DN32980_c0_g1_i1.p1 TRINITY_DN32980_c0_g1~~TRINITY_DN32980_c0_g1_i1.p1  ORF type:complete len:637 (+),score=177.59 TRINITY_DN32980_c0_g1_i1:109-2019(+)
MQTTQEISSLVPAAGNHISHYQNAAALQLMKSERTSLVVRACGRSVMLPDGITSVGDIQGVLQVELGMRDQVFEIYNSEGMQCLNDADVQAAVVEAKLPFTATLSDASIHFIENRREELAQMQWKLMRDQQSQLNLKLSSVCRQVAELQAQQEAERRDRELQCDKMQSELFSTLEALREQARSDFRQIDERVAGVNHLITAERNMREAAMQRLASDLHSIRDGQDVDRTSLRDAASLSGKSVDDLKKIIGQERSLRDAFEERHRLDMEAVRERMDEMTMGLQHVVTDYSRSFEKASAEINDVIETQNRGFHKGNSELHTVLQETRAQLSRLEDRHSSLESRSLESHKRHGEMLDRLNQRNEKVNQSVEVLRFDSTKYGASATSLAQKIVDFEDGIKHLKAELRDSIGGERRRREDEYRSLRDAMMTEHGTLLSNLESRLTSRLERESAAREGSVTDILHGVSESIRKELPFLMGSSASQKDDISEQGTLPASSSSPLQTAAPRSASLLRQRVSLAESTRAPSLASAPGVVNRGSFSSQHHVGYVAAYAHPVTPGAPQIASYPMPIKNLPANGTATPLTAQVLSAHSTPTAGTPRAVTPISRGGSMSLPVNQFAYMPRTTSGSILMGTPMSARDGAA